jgi:nucleoside-diphosphate-sugar epimerase
MAVKCALVCGAGGFIGSHLVRRLKVEGYYVIGADLKYPEFSDTAADEFHLSDLRYLENVERILQYGVTEVYQLAADMGGAGYIFTGEHDANVMHNSAMINLHVAKRATELKAKVFFSSSACIYPEYNQTDPNNPKCNEESVYPAAPDSEYGWEKLFSERLYKSFARNYGLDVCIARFHNIFGPDGSWNNGKEKAPAAICRKVAEVKDWDWISIWGDGEQTRSFLYIDECLEGIRRLMKSPEGYEPLNVGSDEMVTINQLVEMVARVAGKHIRVTHTTGPTGVRGRCSDNKLIKEKLDWSPNYPLYIGLEKTYAWINNQVNG